MVTAKNCFEKWGDPLTTFDESGYMVMWDVPAELEVGVIPKKLYCNKELIGSLTQAIKNLIHRGFINELKTWDGCFNVRVQRGYETTYKVLMDDGHVDLALKYLSIHCWGIAIDLNAAWNQLKMKPTLSPGFVQCFIDAGFDWGGNFGRLDGMHFQLAKI